MLPGNSLRLGTIRGIELAIHYSWPLAAILLTWSLARGWFPQAYPGWGSTPGNRGRASRAWSRCTVTSAARSLPADRPRSRASRQHRAARMSLPPGGADRAARRRPPAPPTTVPCGATQGGRKRPIPPLGQSRPSSCSPLCPSTSSDTRWPRSASGSRSARSSSSSSAVSPRWSASRTGRGRSSGSR